MTELRRCIGSTRFGIEPHDAPVADFPKQPSQKDGLGRMCRAHWNQYTAGLARDAKARKGTSVGETAPAKVPDVQGATRGAKAGRTASPKTASPGKVRAAPERRTVRPVADEPAGMAEVGTEP